MRHIAAALVVIALLACSFFAELSDFTQKSQDGWNALTIVGLIVFAILVLFADDPEVEVEKERSKQETRRASWPRVK